MQLTPHFQREEFELEEPMPEECVPVFTLLCSELLEPIRAQFGPVLITSGYRSPLGNTVAHGIPDSEHVATDSYCAADWYVQQFIRGLGGMRPVFDWIRLNSRLQWHQLILEHGTRSDVIHLSYNKNLNSTKRNAKEGAVHNLTTYVDWSVAPYVPDSVQA